MPYYGSDAYAKEMQEKMKSAASAKRAETFLDVARQNRAAAERANAVSEAAQQRQYEMNLQMMREANALQASMFNQSMAFNSQQSDLAWQRSQQNWSQTADYNAQQNAIAQQYNSAEAEKQRQWQEYMSNTSYQRAMEDMRKAGLNPILAYMQGGASTPVGSSGSISGASMSNLSAQRASMSPGSAHSGSVSSFSGALENTSNTLAIIGAISDLMEFVTSPDGKTSEVGKTVSNAKNFIETLGEAFSKFTKKHPWLAEPLFKGEEWDSFRQSHGKFRGHF